MKPSSADRISSLEAVTQQRKFRFTTVSVLASLFAIIMMNNCISRVVSRYQFASTSITTDAQVLSFTTSLLTRSTRVTKAQIRFGAKDGTIIQTSVTDYGSSDISAPGKTVRIRYQPENPKDDLMTEAEFSKLNEPISYGVVSLIFFGLAYFVGKTAKERSVP